MRTGIPKLDDANDAGGRNSHQCTLILTEGDSAKTLAISGLSVVGRDHFGVFPLRCVLSGSYACDRILCLWPAPILDQHDVCRALCFSIPLLIPDTQLLCVHFARCRGKLLNVRDASAAQISANAEIQNLKQILGLQHGKVGCSIVCTVSSCVCSVGGEGCRGGCVLSVHTPEPHVVTCFSVVSLLFLPIVSLVLPGVRGCQVPALRPPDDHDGSGSRWLTHQRPHHELPARLLPLAAQDPWLPARVHHPHCQGGYQKHACSFSTLLCSVHNMQCMLLLTPAKLALCTKQGVCHESQMINQVAAWYLPHKQPPVCG